MLHSQNFIRLLIKNDLLVFLDHQSTTQFLYHACFSILRNESSKRLSVHVSFPCKEENWESENWFWQRVHPKASVIPVIPVHPVNGEMLQHGESILLEYTIKCLFGSKYFVSVRKIFLVRLLV